MSLRVSCESVKKPDNQCCFLGIFTIILCISLDILSILHLMPLRNQNLKFVEKELNINDHAFTFVATTTLIVGSLWALAAVLLIIGVKKNLPGFVLCYFVYSIFVTIVVNLEALLLVLHNNWIIALSLTLATTVYIPCLAGVHKIYNIMERGKVFGDNQHDLLEECDV